MPALIYTKDLTGESNTDIAARPGSIPGMYDRAGSVWEIDSGGAVNTQNIGQQNRKGHLLPYHASYTPVKHQKTTFRFVFTNGGYLAVFSRVKDNGSIDAYVAQRNYLGGGAYTHDRLVDNTNNNGGVSNGTGTPNATTATVTWTNGHTYNWTVEVDEVSAGVWSAVHTIYDEASPGTVDTFTLACTNGDSFTLADTALPAGIASTGPSGMKVLDVNVWDMDASDELAAGTVSVVETTLSQITLQTTAASGGTAPYTYQWHRSASASFTPGPATAIADATDTLVYDSPSHGTWYYKCVVTDAVDATATSNEVSAARDQDTVHVYFVGSSTTEYAPGGKSPVQHCDDHFGASHALYNHGHGGAILADFATGGTYHAALFDAIAASISGDRKARVSVCIGSNDAAYSIAAATFLAALQDFVDALRTAGAERVTLNFIGWRVLTEGFTEVQLQLIRDYNAGLSTITGARVGDRTWFARTEPGEGQTWEDVGLYGDGTHPNAAGAELLGGLWARALRPGVSSGIGPLLA
jgi:lysophospholipase L1-like esterase